MYYQSNTEESARSPIGFVSDTVLMARVKSKFMSDDMVDDNEIHIKVRHGVVYLDGWVSDTYQRRMAEDLVRSIDGVGRVVSRLQISNPGTVFINPDIR
ncbi:BON domain-containing protein [Desulfobacter postgatei]|uniref:BON domain-containing protein n=1 Tax=Desulfobacter postgatei TaxID=2293 RepID=UPI00259B4A33|nr:BON domain-containing protein [uncultured Desulfobacter sp.]